ncbi:MAG: hypothetical protein JSS54_10450 [Proteobacteria bacterium]|nr:hypothetical protein [Pseudomonadota bacterium]
MAEISLLSGADFDERVTDRGLALGRHFGGPTIKQSRSKYRQSIFLASMNCARLMVVKRKAKGEFQRSHRSSSDEKEIHSQQECHHER